MVLTRRSAAAALSAAAVMLTSCNGVSAFAPPSAAAHTRNNCIGTSQCEAASPLPRATTQVHLFDLLKKEDEALATTNGAVELVDESSEGDWVDESKKVELILLGIWGASISGFILVNNFYGPWPEVLRTVPERTFFLSHMIGGMLFGGGIILTTCIERLVAKSGNPQVLQFWFDKVPELDGLIVVPALTISMVSGTGLSIVRYGGLNIAPPHVGAIFWTLIAFMTWWAATDLTTQGTALKAVERMYEQYEMGEEGLETPKVVVDRHVSNVVSCFFVLLLYSFMVLKPGTLFPFPWNA
ncbi:hypothetical protein ACHAXT_001801 [Thalassiosira profunda]